MQKMKQSIVFSAQIDRTLCSGDDKPIIVDQPDKLALITWHWQELATLVNEHVFVEDGWLLEIFIEIKCSPTEEAWGMGYLKFLRKGKFGGHGQEQSFSFKVDADGFSKDKVFEPAPKLSASDLLVKVVELAEECGLGREKTSEEYDTDLSPDRRREVLRKEAVKVLK